MEKTDDLENRSRRSNLCFEGIDEVAKDANETWQQSEDKVKTIISDKLELDSDDIPIERAHRVGARKDRKPRTIVVKFLRYKDREKVLKSRRKLKGSKVVIREDFSDRVAEKRKQLIPKMLEERKNGKIAYLRYDN